MIITTGVASLLLIIIIQSIAFAYYMGKLRTDVDAIQVEMRRFLDLKISNKDAINELRLEFVEFRKEIQTLLIPKTRKRTET